MNELERRMVGKSIRASLDAIEDRFEEVRAVAELSTDSEEILCLIAELDRLDDALKELKDITKEVLRGHESN